MSLKTLAITGNDLIRLGIPQGKQIGELLQSLLEDVIQNPENNTYTYLIKKAKELSGIF